jgi:hypothetical protein
MPVPNYEDYIVSTPKCWRVIHRTSVNLAEAIMKNGLVSLGLDTTATLQDKDIKKAKHSFEESHKGNDAVVIIQISADLFSAIMKKLEAEEGGKIRWNEIFEDPLIADFKKGFVIKPEFILGYVNKRDNSIHFNPKFKEQ